MAGRFAIIKVDLETKEVQVSGLNGGGGAVSVGAGNPPSGAEKLGEVHWAQNSPGCVYWVGNVPVKVC
jgi:hypothetical protein